MLGMIDCFRRSTLLFFERGNNCGDESCDDVEREGRIGSDELITEHDGGLEEEGRKVSTVEQGLIKMEEGDGAKKTDGRNSSVGIDKVLSVSSLGSIVLTSSCSSNGSK